MGMNTGKRVESVAGMKKPVLGRHWYPA